MPVVRRAAANGIPSGMARCWLPPLLANRHGSNRGSAPSIERALIRVQPQKTGSDARGVRWPRGVGLPRQLATSSKAARHYSANSCNAQKSSIATVSPHLRARDFRLVAVFVSRPLCWLRPTLPANSATRKRRLLNHAPLAMSRPSQLIDLQCSASSEQRHGPGAAEPQQEKICKIAFPVGQW